MSGIALVAVAALALTACGPSSSSPGASDPIPIGAVSSTSGQITFPGVSESAQAVFDRVNQEGGINGRQISYTVEDDQATPALAAQGARKLVDQDGVYAMAGGISTVDCTANAAYYEQNSVYSLPIGASQACFGSGVIAPVNTGPYLNTELLYYYASNELHGKRVCNVQNNNPGGNEALDQSVKNWQDDTGGQFALDIRSLTSTSPASGVVQQIKEANCDVIVLGVYSELFVSMMKAADEQGLTGVTWVSPGTVFTEDVGLALKGNGQKIYLGSEFLPYTTADSGSADLQDYLQLMKKNNIPVGSLQEGGYVAAMALVDVLKGIKGDITRDSVGAALKDMNVQTTMVGTPLKFGVQGNNAGPNKAIMMVTLDPSSGSWMPVDGKWFTKAS
ncbi:ABC transporter substrate-binding protein [Microbacterium sp. SORGH_AS_0888]|uniref:ABC transporter substrate-binding protein n=1 Tax=Microbacterium sp. SORGH_AS_0888 TaxID=3041791 RepID=UPI0027D90A3C|nr:ABC transporter substrate-binding protein [Microbacterium sp. SORGH_AS_0888]